MKNVNRKLMVVDIFASIGGLIVDFIKATQYLVETTPNVCNTRFRCIITI